jgi:hypothetical protein
MSSQVYKAQDVATIRATIENEGIDPIQGRPNCMKLIHFLNQVTEGAKQVECEYSNFGMMWVCLPQDVYVQITNENITAPVVPPLVPPFHEHGTPAYNAQVQVTWQKNKELSDQRKKHRKSAHRTCKNCAGRQLSSHTHPTLHRTSGPQVFGSLWTHVDKMGQPNTA